MATTSRKKTAARSTRCPSLLHLPCTSCPGRKVDGGGRPSSGEWVVEPDRLGLDVGEYAFEDRAEVLIRCVVGPHGKRATRDDMSGCGSYTVIGVEVSMWIVEQVAGRVVDVEQDRVIGSATVLRIESHHACGGGEEVRATLGLIP